jgi:hypothetical protein
MLATITQSLRSANRHAERLPVLGLDLDSQLLTLCNDPQEWQSHNASHEMPVRFSDAAADKIVPQLSKAPHTLSVVFGGL